MSETSVVAGRGRLELQEREQQTGHLPGTGRDASESQRKRPWTWSDDLLSSFSSVIKQLRNVGQAS